MQIDIITDTFGKFEVTVDGVYVTKNNNSLSQAIKKLHKYLVGQGL